MKCLAKFDVVILTGALVVSSAAARAGCGGAACAVVATGYVNGCHYVINRSTQEVLVHWGAFSWDLASNGRGQVVYAGQCVQSFLGDMTANYKYGANPPAPTDGVRHRYISVHNIEDSALRVETRTGVADCDRNPPGFPTLVAATRYVLGGLADGTRVVCARYQLPDGSWSSWAHADWNSLDCEHVRGICSINLP